MDAADSPSKFEPMKPKPPSESNTLSRSGTLSWQQRPQSRGSPTARPLSKRDIQQGGDGADTNKSMGEDNVESATPLNKLTRSFERKDPAWFRQTADRGLGSAAYRKNQNPESNTMGKNVELPGLTRQTSSELSNVQSYRSNDTTLAPNEDTKSNTVQAEKTPTWKTSSSTTKSPLPLLSSQRLDPPSADTSTSFDNDATLDRAQTTSASQGRTSPDRIERPASPTKGLGGFVRSAMMKRSDSVSKRWSAQGVTGLSRGNSIASNRGGLDSIRGSVHGRSSALDSDSISQNRERSPLSSSRPGSSHSPSAASRAQNVSADLEPQTFGSSKSSVLEQNLEKSQEDESAPDPAEISRPSSPNKFADQKRWSPTKSSWLESAINKPGSPKPKPITPQQPSWMAEINRAKQAREARDVGAGDMGKSSSHKEVPIGGFLRSPPMGSPLKSPSPGNFPHTASSDKTPMLGPTSTFPKVNKVESEPLTAESSERIESASPSASVLETEPKSLQEISGSVTPSGQRKENQKAPVQKAKPITPPKKDFRAGLKSRQVPEDKDSTNQPEFKSVFGKLKKTETKNYIAPDELKNNILRGKAGLALTGGPKKSERKDEFKEDILRKKEEMKLASGISKGAPQKDAVKMPVPEAIAKKKGLAARTGSIKSTEERGPSDNVAVGSGGEEKPSQSLPTKKTSAPGRLQGPVNGANPVLADRFSSNLASIIARGPSPMTPPAGSSAETESRPTTTDRPSQGEFQSQASQLTHATKSRARGPKRRLPASIKSSEANESITISEAPKVVAKAAKSPAFSSERPWPANLSNPPSSTSMANIAKSEDKPQPSSKPISLTQSTDESKGRMPSSRAFTPPITPRPTPKSPPATNPKGLPSDTMTSALKQDGRYSVGLGITSQIPGQVVSPPSLAAKPPKSPPIPAKKSEALSRIVSNGSIASQSASMSRSPIPKTAEARRIIADFFDEVPSSGTKQDVNAQEVLTNSSSAIPKIKTLRKEIWEITGDGKRVPVPAQQEHILFEDNMYLCNHVFGSTGGKRTTETYLWCGDGVPSSSVEDAQLFCRNAAKEAGGKLIILKQGKESSNFFEALGGIVITRKSSSSGSSSANYLLCGRRHMGQIAFDEVEFTAGSLCSAFPYLVAAPGGKLYLWKGKGSGADELGCARLIGMDLGLSGEIDEIDEGSEPNAFWSVFKTSEKRVASAEYWPRKAACENFCTRLFVVDADARPKSSSSSMWSRLSGSPTREDCPNSQIKEISPYSQADIPRDSVSILDAFFEIYV